MDIRLVDCTLRDGGYVNDWNFGFNTTICVLERLIESGVEIIEVGFLDERQPFNPDRTIQPNTACYDEILSSVDPKNAMLVGMIDYGTCSIENIAPCKDTVLDGIRLIFKLPKMKEAVAFGEKLIGLGYKVFLQLVSITSYSDRDILDFVDLVNQINPYAVSMVDTYGLLDKNDLLHYFHILDYNLKPEIKIGYHSHNNFQLAYANTCELIKRKSNHNLIVDGTVYGMGKSAGNAPLELLAMHLNENYGKNYDISQILEVIDTCILKIYRQQYWGYNLLYFLSASNDCHPNYINYLLDKRTLSVKSINEIVEKIPIDKKLNYDKACIEQLYLNYQKQFLKGDRSIEALKKIISGNEVLVLGPGKTIVSHHNSIDDYIKKNKPIVITANFIPKHYSADFVFFGNSKRYNMLLSELMKNKENFAVIATSNVTSVGKSFDYVLSYDELIDDDKRIEDNALIMLLKALSACETKKVLLAGFDGFSSHSKDNYYNEFMDYSSDYERLSVVNDAIKAKLPVLMEKLQIEFLTPSRYN